MIKQAIIIDNPIFRGTGGVSIFDRFSYSAAVRAGDFIYVAGQVGLNPDGTIPHEDATQFHNAFKRLKIVLEEAGASLQDIVELVSYHVDLQKEGHLDAFVEVKNAYIFQPYPTWTILGVQGLARPGLNIEIKAIAYVAPAVTC